jgi:hypothetical protein
MNKLNILDVEKKGLSMRRPLQLDESSDSINLSVINRNCSDTTIWIDVCQANGNLLASCGQDEQIKVFDRRESRIVKRFQDIHAGGF